MLLNNQQITEEIKKEINICIEMNEMKTQQPKTCGMVIKDTQLLQQQCDNTSGAGRQGSP